MSEQDYIPGTRVIRNLVGRSEATPFGTTDQQALADAEAFYVSTRMAELHTAPVQGNFNFSHMREIHRHLFQDVYAWAGEPRRVPMQKLGTDYAEPLEMNALLREQYAGLAEQNHLRGISSREEFTRQLAGVWAEMNHAHAFREGNTRSQTVFFAQLANNAGWTLDVARLSPDHPLSVYRPFVDARFEHQRIRRAEGLSSQEAALDLANVLYGLIEPDRSPQGNLRRGVAVPTGASTDPTTTTREELHARHPELRGMRLDRYGLDDNDDTISLTDPKTEYQR